MFQQTIPAQRRTVCQSERQARGGHSCRQVLVSILYRHLHSNQFDQHPFLCVAVALFVVNVIMQSQWANNVSPHFPPVHTFYSTLKALVVGDLHVNLALQLGLHTQAQCATVGPKHVLIQTISNSCVIAVAAQVKNILVGFWYLCC